MERNTERVLKSSDVEVSGRIQLPGITPGPDASARSAQPSFPAKATIVENNPEFALIEVACPCGRKTTVKCEYKAAD
jgi:hypothetical protein